MPPTLLFAATSDASWWERARENPNAAFSPGEMLIGISAILAAALVWWLWVRWRRFRDELEHSSPSGLFVELCRAHHLSRREQAMLRAVARAHRLPQPAQVFLRPELYWPPHVPPQFAERQRELAHLHGRVFDTEKQAEVV